MSVDGNYPNVDSGLGDTQTVEPPTRYSIVIDFDGVIHSYVSGWQGADVIPDPPVDGAIAWLLEMVEHYDLVIATTRANELAGVDAIIEWLAVNGFNPADGRVSIVGKPAGVLYVDDRGYRFNGRFPSLEAVRYGLRPWRAGDAPRTTNGDRARKRGQELQQMQERVIRLKRERAKLYVELIRETLARCGVDGDVAAEWLRQHDGSFEAQLEAARELRDAG